MCACVQFTSQPSLPSTARFSVGILTRELNSVKQELRTLKTEIAGLNRQSSSTLPGEFQMEICKELKALKLEVSHVRESMYKNSSAQIPSQPPYSESKQEQKFSAVDSITITTWNCRGLTNAIPYIDHLIESGSDVIALTEHWLWPYHLNRLEEISPQYTGFGVSSTKLNESSDLSRGCGGVGIIWKKSLPILPVTQITSDRFCVVQLLPPDSARSLYIVSVYLPSSNYSAEEFSDFLSELQNAVSILQQSGQVILAGDFNCHLRDPDSNQEKVRLMSDFIHQHDLYVASLDEGVEGPGYTFFSSSVNTMVDYIMIQSSLAFDLKSCRIHHHHPLNLSDHLPVSLTINSSIEPCVSKQPQSLGVNWFKAVERGDIQSYANAVSFVVSPLIFNSYQSESELNDEINCVCQAMLEASHEHLPHISHKKKEKRFIKDPELKSLCKQSRIAWEKWAKADKPKEGPLADAKKSTKYLVRQFVSRSRARIERAEIQKRDDLFKKKDRFRFKTSKHRSSCKMLHIDGSSITDGQDIANHFKSFFSSLAKSNTSSSTLRAATSNVPQLEERSYGHSDQVIDDNIDIEEIERALKLLKQNKSGGLDGLKAEHFKYGGEHLKLWLKKIFNRILALEDTPQCMKDGLIIPVYKRQGKNPLLLNSYRGITMSPILCKILEIILLQRLSPLLQDAGSPHMLQTAYQRGVSCMDAIFATQEALLTHYRDGGQPYLCLFDLEKAYDSVELPVLLERLFDLGINGKFWRFIKNWYTGSRGRVRVDGHLSDAFPVNRGVRQGSVLSPTLFLTVMDKLLESMTTEGCGLSVCGTFIGAAIHADDVRTCATTKQTVAKQNEIITNFTDSSCLSLNTQKLEVVQVGQKPNTSQSLEIGGHVIPLSESVKCLGVWWQHNLSAARAVTENISKARKAFFALGNIGAFQGKLNPLSGSSIFITCILPILLYGCETWILDSNTITKLERFQNEIGRRILQLPKHFSGKVVRLALQWPAMSTRVLIRKLKFLSRLTSDSNDVELISKEIFSSLAAVDVYKLSIIQQCRMLESSLGTGVLAMCLNEPGKASSIVAEQKPHLISKDFQLLIEHSLSHKSAKLVAEVVQTTSWCRLWDIALDRGVKGTRGLQTLLREMCRPIFTNSVCTLCEADIDQNSLWFEHICCKHPDIVNNRSVSQVITSLCKLDHEEIFAVANSNLSKCSLS